MPSIRGALLLGVQFAMAAATSPAIPRRPAPTPPVRELLRRAETAPWNWWNRELRAASEFATGRLRRRLRYNDYLPEDAPGSLLSLEEDIDDSTTKCLSPLQKWFVSLIVSIGVETWEEIDAYNITSLTYIYKHHVSNADGTNEYFGTYGDRTDEMKENHESLAKFWSTESSDNVVLLGMHGVDLAEDAKLVPTLQHMYDLGGNEALAQAGRIQKIVQSLPGAFNNPVLTANAIAIQSVHPDGSNAERDSIIIGDGVFAFLQWLNLEKDGPDYIHSHEFGHHLQYDLGVNGVGNGWTAGEETRRWETMADAFGSYYLAHARGGAMGGVRLEEVHRAAYSLGDCEDAIGSHHGTPRQRRCASNYGANLALASRLDDGRVMSPLELRRMFDRKYESILDLEDVECRAVADADRLDAAVYGEIVGNSAAGGGADGPPPGDVPVPSPAIASPPQSKYEPFGGYTPFKTAPPQSSWNYGQSEYKPAKTAPPQSTWTYGGAFGAPAPEEEPRGDPRGIPPPADDESDEPPAAARNGTDDEGREWLGKTESKWHGRTSRSGGAYSGVGWTPIAAVAATIALSLAWI